ncbi:MAG: PQQ-binding-like beta-propeller repeat protein [Desulfobacterales bacterium]|nr:PQQ-binding-like beta-propeller repeat protein [Desulfobacterales bacterium]
MHCVKCGIENRDDSRLCGLCNAELVPGKADEDTKIFIDLTRHSIGEVLSMRKGMNPLLATIAVALVLIVYYFKKLTRKPLYLSFLNGISPRIRLVREEEIKGAHKKTRDKIGSFFVQNGFEPFLVYENGNATQSVFIHVWVNREKKIHGTALINRAAGRLLYLSFSAVTRNKSYISINNTSGIPISYPKNCVVRYFPAYSKEEIYQEITGVLANLGQEPLLLSPASFLVVQNKIETLTVRLGIRDGFFHIKDADDAPGAEGRPGAKKRADLKKTPGQATCFFHPFNVAVRVCATCNTHLCEACYTERDARYYCEKHLPAESESPPSILSMARTRLQSEAFEFAGLGVRTLAFFLDAVIIGMFTAALGLGFSFSLGAMGFARHSEISILIGQLFLVGFSVYYFTGYFAGRGQTAGKKILGLHVVDRQGNPPDIATSLVRFSYYLLTCLFVFPLIGHIMILFRKSKQGFHDQLAGTHVVTRINGKKAVISWFILVWILIGVGWPARMWIPLFFSSLPEPEIALEKKWSHPEGSVPGSVISSKIHGKRCIVSTMDGVHAIDISTGSILWTADDLLAGAPPHLENRKDGPLLFFERDGKDARFLIRVEPETGDILWKTPVNMTRASLQSDDQLILVNGAAEARGFDMNGRLLWTRRFKGESEFTTAFLNQVALIQTFSKTSSRGLMALSRDSGEILWEEKESAYNPAQSLGNGYHLFYTNSGGTALFYLPEQKVVWKRPGLFAPVMVDSAVAREAPPAPPPRLYTKSIVIDGKDGSTLRSHPPGVVMMCVTEAYLVLMTKFKPGASPGPGKVLLIDKFSGKVEKTYIGKPKGVLSLIHEDPRRIYLAATQAPPNPRGGDFASILMIIEKNTLELTETPLGKNIFTFHSRFKIFPEENIIVIPSFGGIGAYILPDVIN